MIGSEHENATPGEDVPVVSVIVPCHNATATLGLQLEALARQQDAPPFEVVIVDNNSADDLDRFVAASRHRLGSVRVVPAPNAAGAGYARNVGVAHARATKLLFCDADDLIGADWVRAGAAALDHVDLACGADVTLPYTAFTTVDAVWREHLPATDEPAVEPGTPSAYPIVLGGNLAVRRSAFVRIGGFDASMTSGNEDNDFAVRAQAAGYLVHRAPGMRIAIRERADLRSFFRRARVAGRGHIQLVDRHGLRDASPHLRGGAWRTDAPRVVAAAALMAVKSADERDWPAVATRAGVAVGLWEGEIRSKFKPVTPSAIGLGLGNDSGDE